MISWRFTVRIYFILSSLLLTALCSACGFQPIYAEATPGSASSDVPSALANVEVLPIPERAGQLVYNRLTDRLTASSGESAYQLTVAIDEKYEGFGFEDDASITRQRQTMTAIFRLIDAKSGAIVFDDRLSTDVTIDVIQNDYANLVAEQRASERNAKRIADLIMQRLALVFLNNQTAEQVSG
ncbi:MAG: LPS assembly lipoprotein LptE [Pseudomonadota bacterium]